MNASAPWLEKHISSRHALETTSSMYWFFTIKRAKASARQRAMTEQKYYIHTCTWNDISNVLGFYNQAGQSQWTPARHDWKNMSHPNMHRKTHLQCIMFLYSSRTKPVNASAHWFEKPITSRHALETTSAMYFLQSSRRKPVNASAHWLEKHITF